MDQPKKRTTKHLYPGEITNPILKKWLSGTTCFNYWIGRSALFENNEYIVLKHNSHIAYCDRFTGSGTCRAYAELYRKGDLALDSTGYNQKLFNGSGGMRRWEGRINKPQVIADCKQMGIEFSVGKSTGSVPNE